MSATRTAAGPWAFESLADAELPLELGRYEVVDGHLVVRPDMTVAHYGAGFRMASAIAAALPPGWLAQTELGVTLKRDGWRADFGVYRAAPVTETVAGTWQWLQREGMPAQRPDRAVHGLPEELEQRVLAGRSSTAP